MEYNGKGIDLLLVSQLQKKLAHDNAGNAIRFFVNDHLSQTPVGSPCTLTESRILGIRAPFSDFFGRFATRWILVNIS